METISTSQMKDIKDNAQGTPLINVLPEEAFKEEHIARSANVPVDRDDFAKQVEKLAGGKDQRVVVYCASETCDASPKAAEKLEEAGFTDVLDYEGGTKAWKEQGLPVESSN